VVSAQLQGIDIPLLPHYDVERMKDLCHHGGIIEARWGPHMLCRLLSAFDRFLNSQQGKCSAPEAAAYWHNLWWTDPTLRNLKSLDSKPYIVVAGPFRASTGIHRHTPTTAPLSSCGPTTAAIPIPTRLRQVVRNRTNTIQVIGTEVSRPTTGRPEWAREAARLVRGRAVRTG
jgi:hypothetical protein